MFVVAPAEFGWGVEGGLGSDAYATAASPDVLLLSPDVRSPRGATARAGGGASSGNVKGRLNTVLCGDVFVVKAESLDVALWKIGGAAVGLRLVQLASVRSSGFFLFVLCGFTDHFRYSLPIDFARVVSYTGHPNRRVEEQLAEFRGHGTVASVFLPL